MRVAVQPGATVVRVARPGPDGAPRVVEVPAEAGVPLPVLLRGLLDGATETVLLGRAAGLPGRVVAVDAAVAVAGGRAEALVLDVGASATRVRMVRGGRVVARRTAPGGDRLGAAATWVEVVGAAREVAGRPDVPVLLAGGCARAPGLAACLDAAGFVDVTVVPRPDAAAVLAALDLPLPPAVPPPGGWCPPPQPWLPPVPEPVRRRGRVLLGAAAVAAALGALHALGRLVEPGAEPPPEGVLAQYGYRLALPAGWAHTGGLPERRRSLLTPVAAPEGSDLIAVEATPLGYDASAEPRRAAAELRAEFDAAGPALSGYEADARFGGRAVTAYREQDGVTQVRWYVVLDGGTQLSVGCRHTPSGAAAVAAACAEVVATIRGG
ncbi:type VII secretion-associated protein [Pseudonocardia hydrocarbonoxydans]|uniref:Type VII secretion-associated protein n=1 Tax=Pseudonocardia hydrocarbonoxydans TaxID=76726 RepID=A0A4Y3WRE6_9PSEU|nr:type VII secretion-associated protein [Pseudonocardia hydrocarbonoxydans]GEC20369.1 hypothetical protein PHY01_26520 [Pseudonocardia hydrocarbonoxydans]